MLNDSLEGTLPKRNFICYDNMRGGEMELLDEIKNEYIRGNSSYRELSAKFGVTYSEIAARAKQECWVELRKAFKESGVEKRLDTVTLRLIEKLERAIDELDSHITTVRIKEKSTEYDEEGKKAVSERIVESEELHIEKGPIDRNALKQLASTLKELKGKEEQTEDTSVEVVLSDEARELAV
ncbi:MAG: hypothetical protein IKU52_05120 [Clostridia bacterium]|nr:hypothetical protein [Clostridia bacterium]